MNFSQDVFPFCLDVCGNRIFLRSCTYENIRYHLLKLVTSPSFLKDSFTQTFFDCTITSTSFSSSFNFRFFVSNYILRFPKGLKYKLLVWLHSLPIE